MSYLLKYKLLQSYIYEPEEEKFEFDASNADSKYTILRVGSNPLNVLDANDNLIDFSIQLNNVPGNIYYFMGTKSEYNKYFTKVGSTNKITIGTLGTNAGDEITVYLFSRGAQYNFSMSANSMDDSNFNIIGTTNQYAGIDYDSDIYRDRVENAYKNIIKKETPFIQVGGYYGAIDLGPHTYNPDVTFGYMIGSAKSLNLYKYSTCEGTYKNLFNGASIKMTPNIGSASFAYNSILLHEKSCLQMFNNCSLLEQADIYICINIEETTYDVTVGTIHLNNSNIGHHAFGEVSIIYDYFDQYYKITNESGIFNNCTNLKEVNIYIGFVNPAGNYYFANQQYTNYGSGILGNILFWGESSFTTYTTESVFGIIDRTGIFGAIDNCGSESTSKNINIHNVKGSNIDLTSFKNKLYNLYRDNIPYWTINIK